MSTSKKGRGRVGRGKAAQTAAPTAAVTGAVDVDSAIEAETQAIGRDLLTRLERRSPSIFERRWWDDRILSWAMADESVKVQMFRFVDVLPMLHTHDAVTRHLQEYFDEVRSHLPLAVRLGLEISQPNSVLGKALALNARSNATRMSQRFIAGAKVEEVLAAVTKLRKQGFAFTLDLLGEATTSERDADAYQRAYLNLIEGMAGEVQSWSEVPRLDRDHEGIIPRVNLSLKLSALYSQFRPIDAAGTAEHVKARLRPLLRAAREHDAYIHVDMEQYAYKDLTFEIFKEILMEDEFRDFPDVGIVLQAYMPEAQRDAESLLEWATARGTPIWVRLVKGAYWDYETIMAQVHGWPIPVYQQKWESDANFERLIRFLMENYRWLRPALGSHNIRSLSYGIACAKQLGVPEGAYELQMLFGMGGDQAQLLADRGQRVRIYMPFGELIPGMAYLVRRLLENTSNDSFLRQSFTEQVSIEDLLMKPTDAAARPVSSARLAARMPAEPVSTFTNEPTTDFSRAEARKAMERAVKETAEEFGKEYPLVINGRAIETMGKIKSINPSHKSKVVGTVSSATAEDASLAIDAARRAFKQWSRVEPDHRAEYLELTAAMMRNQRFELAAWEVHECGKPWIEADADVAEAIDFCMYYAAQARRMMSGHRCDLPGEENDYSYRPRGVAVIIAPWNFPLAILTGMTAAALVTGNTVIMKPAEQSSIVGYKLMEILQNVGIPDGVVNFLPGVGEDVGPELVGSPDVNLIAFTGSRTVGLAINHEASKPDDRQEFVKHVIAEMGGKNAIIVDDDADLDEAVLGVTYSAFGYAGQKCSACSRCIVLESVYDAFVEKLAQATLSLKVGPAELPDTTIGPVIDEDSFKRINEYIKLGKESFPVVAAGEKGVPTDGYYIGPHVFGNVEPTSRMAREEIFGPVLAVIKVKDLDEAFDVANDSAYALTGGLFSRSPANLKRARHELQAGNVYLNRGITGAMVERQPFGGFKLSGIGTKAGGPDYLLQFVIPINITENTFRRGFAPPADEE
ncbi:MAG TPA: L-glutamate gamma-semialdehyde dehydrogenase [Planctomycetaceae bacterium]|jgi:RHH-type proline utilization regulon transcriptional repressor/proline dehydrogenase/delta 1-pyrroline-5-carboxylate dehydrogenase|nr:L-glutamate gamma-semialdehyde dehydrogenase [Planctomycetaceae bacterium]